MSARPDYSLTQFLKEIALELSINPNKNIDHVQIKNVLGERKANRISHDNVAKEIDKNMFET